MKSQIIELESTEYRELSERESSYEIKSNLVKTLGFFFTVFFVGFYYLCAIGLFFILMDPLMR